MVETTPERPTKEPTSLEQMQEQLPPTIQTEAQIHFDEGGNASVETRSDKSEVNMVQPEPQENTQEQSVDIPPVRSGIQHSASVSEEIESVEPDEPPIPTNETVNLETIEEQQPTLVTHEAEVHFSESGRVSFRPGTLTLRSSGEHQANQKPGSNIIEPTPGTSGMQRRPGSNIIEPAPGRSGMQYLTPSPSRQQAISRPPSPCASFLNIHSKEPAPCFVDCWACFALMFLLVFILSISVGFFAASIIHRNDEYHSNWFAFIGFVAAIIFLYVTSLFNGLLVDNRTYQGCLRYVIPILTCCYRNRKHEVENTNDQNPNTNPRIYVTDVAGSRVQFRSS